MDVTGSRVDGTDVKMALQEFVKGQWDGDVDLGDGQAG